MLEKLLPLKLPPGLYRNGTRYQAKGRWYDANLVRFYEGAIRPVQGWRVAFDEFGEELPALEGVPRAALGWRSAAGEALLAIGTTEKLYVIKNGTTYDITPSDFVGGSASASPGVRATGTLTSTGTNPADGETVTVGSITYTFKNTLAAANQVQIAATAALTLVNLKDAINLTGVAGTDYGVGTTVNTKARVFGYTATTLRLEAWTPGSAGNSIATTETSAQLSFGADTLTGGSGGNGDYNFGVYGASLYGVGRAPLAAHLSDADTWQLDAFGDVLVACCTNGGRIYVWTGDVEARAVVATNSPEPNRGVVITPEQFVAALGASSDVRLVAWSTQADYEDWAATDDNTAGDFTLPTNGRIMCGRRTKAQTLIWTDADLYSMNYIGGSVVYSFKQEGDNCGIIAPQAAAIVDTAAIWMGRDNFFVYDGFVKPVPCEVHDHVFGDFNKQQVSKVFACPISEFSEIWWFYPSAGSEENDRYVVYNYREKHWTVGKLGRTAAIDRGAMPAPVMFDANGLIYQHEQSAGTRLVPLPTILSDTLEDTNAVTLQAHTPGGSPLDFDWLKVAGDNLIFDTNILRRDGSTVPFYVANIGLGADDYDVAVPVRVGAAPFASDNYAGVGARMAGGVSKAGYYFVLRSDTPTFALMGFDASGATIFTTLVADVPAALIGADVTLALRVVGSTITGYANGLEILQKTDTTYASGKAGLIGSWPSAAAPSGYGDTFTDTDLVELSTHTPDGTSAFTWTQVGATEIVVKNNYATASPASAPGSRYTATAVTTDGSDYTATIGVVISETPSSSMSCAVLLLEDTGAINGYRAVVSALSSTTIVIDLGRITGGSVTSLDNSGSVSRPAPGIYPLTVRKSGTTVTATFAGHNLSATDNTYTVPDEAGIEVKTNAFYDFAIDYFGAGGTTPSPLLGILGSFVVRGVGTVQQEILVEEGSASFDADGNQYLVPFLESGPIELGDGDQVMRVQHIVPDEKNLGDVRARFFSALMPTDTETEQGPFSLTAPTPVRFTARQVRLRIEEVRPESWRLGTTRLGVIPGGRR